MCVKTCILLNANCLTSPVKEVCNFNLSLFLWICIPTADFYFPHRSLKSIEWQFVRICVKTCILRSLTSSVKEVWKLVSSPMFQSQPPVVNMHISNWFFLSLIIRLIFNIGQSYFELCSTIALNLSSITRASTLKHKQNSSNWEFYCQVRSHGPPPCLQWISIISFIYLWRPRPNGSIVCML